MAQPQQQYAPPRPYASPHTTPSPIPQGTTPAFAAPPVKRPQHSPTSPASPYPPLHSPTVGSNGISSLQNNPYHSQGSNPYPLPPNHASLSQGQTPVRQTPPPSTTQAMQQPALNVMGPPPNKPDDDKPMDLNDIQDVMTGSGIDLKAEEAALIYDAGSRRPSHVSNGPPQGYFDSQRNTMQVNVPGNRDSFYGSGPYNQPAQAITPKDIEDELAAKEKLSIRRRNERDQYHSNNPFLQNRIVLQKLDVAGKKTQTTPPMEGVFHPQRPITTKLIISGPEGQEKIATLTKEPLLSTTAPMVDILSLVSLAARERLRSAIEDMASLARGRRLTASGIVPPDFADIAIGSGKTREEVAEPTPLIGDASPGTNSRKRSHSQANEIPTPVSEADKDEKPARVSTIAFPDLVSRALQKQAEEEAVLEREREAKRHKRQTANLVSSSDPNSRVPSAPGTPASSSAGPIDAIAPEARLTKKEQKRREDERMAAASAKDQKSALAMALGGGSKKYSWMSGGKSAGGGLGSSFGKRGPAATPAKKQPEAVSTSSPTTGPTSVPTGATVRGNQVLGAFREDREDGRGIQMRDVISVLGDGHEKKTLSKAYGRLK